MEGKHYHIVCDTGWNSVDCNVIAKLRLLEYGDHGRAADNFHQRVGDVQLLDLPTAIGRMTLLPAQRLENYAPAFKRKGRIQPSKDADITIFDPAIIRDNGILGTRTGQGYYT